MARNHEIASMLREIGTLLQIKGENLFKTRAYETAAFRIEELSESEYETRVQQGTLDELPGIGEAISKKIATFHATGTVPLYDALRAEFPRELLELLRLPDLGPKKLAILRRELAVGCLADLEKACRDGRVRVLKGFGEKTEAKLFDAIMRLQQADSRRPLGAVRPIAEQWVERLRRIPGVVRVEIAGSVRRYREMVNDVDLVVSGDDPAGIFDTVVQMPLVDRVLGRGDTKCSVVLQDGLQVDVRVLPDDRFATALHHFTGSKNHHIRVRGYAQSRGLKISEWGVERISEGTLVAIAQEEDLYVALGWPYIAPELREDTGEIEAASSGQLPELIDRSDVTGYVHVHSRASDGMSSILDLALAVEALGGSYLTITDHSRAAGYAGGLDEDRLKAQWDEIAQVQEKVRSVRILRGSEVDILEDGCLDFPDSILAQLDVVIGSVHARLNLSEDQMTARIVAAMDNPHLHILGHPTGRLLGKREPYPIRVEEIFDRAVSQGVAIEINGTPERLDLSAEHARMARDRGVKLVLTTDAHCTQNLNYLSYSVGTARRAWVRKLDVLNRLDADFFLQSLRGGSLCNKT